MKVKVQVVLQVQINQQPPPLPHLLTGVIYQDDFLHQLLGRPVDDGVDLGGQYRGAGQGDVVN